MLLYRQRAEKRTQNVYLDWLFIFLQFREKKRIYFGGMKTKSREHKFSIVLQGEEEMLELRGILGIARKIFAMTLCVMTQTGFVELFVA